MTSQADDYQVKCAVQEIAHGATGADLARRGYATHIIDKAIERFVKEAPEAAE